METDPLIRTKKIVSEQVGYLSGILGISKSRVVEVVMDEYVVEHREQLDGITNALMNKDETGLLSARADLMALAE